MSSAFFDYLNSVHSSFTVDRFAITENKKVGQFNSTFYCLGTEGVAAFL